MVKFLKIKAEETHSHKKLTTRYVNIDFIDEIVDVERMKRVDEKLVPAGEWDTHLRVHHDTTESGSHANLATRIFVVPGPKKQAAAIVNQIHELSCASCDAKVESETKPA